LALSVTQVNLQISAALSINHDGFETIGSPVSYAKMQVTQNIKQASVKKFYLSGWEDKKGKKEYNTGNTRGRRKRQ